jgi:hypothetical protein
MAQKDRQRGQKTDDIQIGGELGLHSFNVAGVKIII